MTENPAGFTTFQLKQPDYSADIPETGDLWKKDKLDRKAAAERLVNMIAGQVGPLVVGLNGRWGEGKTFFLKRFQKMYENQKGCAVYFNAWQDDFLDDPLLSLLSQLRKSIDGLPQDTLVDSVKQAVLPVLKHAGVALFKSFVKNAAKIDIDAISTEELETRTEKLIDEYATASTSRDELVKALDKDQATGIDGLTASANEVVSVTYCDLAGRMSNKPFSGVNIVVTRYASGATVTNRVVF